MRHTLLIYANCQGDEIAEMVERSEVLSGLVTIERVFLGFLHEYLDLHGRDEAAARLGRVTAVWQQSCDAGGDERETLRTLVPDDASWTRFPALTCSTLWPFGVSDPRPGSGDLFAYSDTLAARVWREHGGVHGYLAAGTDADLYERYMQLSSTLMPDLDRVLERDIAQWRRRDSESDIQIADFLAGTLRQQPLFFTAGRPSWIPMAEILRRLVTQWLHAPALRDAALREFESFASCFAGNDTLSIPIHPAIARKLQLSWHRDGEAVRWKGSRWDHREWVVRCIRLSPHCE